MMFSTSVSANGGELLPDEETVELQSDDGPESTERAKLILSFE